MYFLSVPQGLLFACVFAFICLFHNIKNQDSSGVLGFNVLCSHMVCFKLVLATEGVFDSSFIAFIVSIMHNIKIFSPFFFSETGFFCSLNSKQDD